MGYWATLLEEWKVALRKGTVEAFFISSVENRNQQRTTYQSLGSIQAYTDYLIRMAEAENAGNSANVMQSITFGVTRGGYL